MLQALRIRDFRLLWGSGLISSLGSWLLILAIPAHIFLVTGSLREAAHLTGVAAAASLTTLSAAALAFLIMPPASAIIPLTRASAETEQ